MRHHILLYTRAPRVSGLSKQRSKCVQTTTLPHLLFNEHYPIIQVVVDDIDFRVGKLKVRDTPIRVDRANDILRPPIKKAAFKMIRNARLPSGKRAPLRPAPISAFSVEPYKEAKDFMASIRGSHREKWTAADSSTGDKLDFCLRLHPDRMKPKSQKACSRMKHPSLTPLEMRGPRWETKRVAQTGSHISGKEKTT